MNLQHPSDDLWLYVETCVLTCIRDHPPTDSQGQPPRYEFVDMLTTDTLEFLTDALTEHLRRHHPPFRRLIDTRAPAPAFDAIANHTIRTCLGDLQIAHAKAHENLDHTFREELPLILEGLLLNGKWMAGEIDG